MPGINELRDLLEDQETALKAAEKRRDDAQTELRAIEKAAMDRGTDGKADQYTAEEAERSAPLADTITKAIAEVEEFRSKVEQTKADISSATKPVEEARTSAKAALAAAEASAAYTPEERQRESVTHGANRATAMGSRHEFKSSVRSYALPVESAHRGRSADEVRASYWATVLDREIDGVTPAQARSVQFDKDTEGGFLAPAPVVADVIKQIDDLVQIRQYATVRQSPLSGLGIPSIETKLSQGSWGGEIKSITDNKSLKFGKRELKPNIYRDKVLVSNVSIASGMAESMVTDELARAAGEAQEQAFIDGSGAGQPLGMFTASNNGIPTGRDVNTGNATAFTVNGLQDVRGKLKQQYRRNARWLLHREALTEIEKILDSDGRPIYVPSMVAGRPDTLLGAPVLESEFAPNNFTNGNYGAIFGDLSKYVIADAMAISISRNPFEHQTTNQTAFYVQFHVDGMPATVGGEAFARQKFSA